MRSHPLVVLLALMIGVSACATSQSGQASEPVLSGQHVASPAGLAALSTAAVDAATCDGVLATPPFTHGLTLRSLTATAQDSDQRIDAMCSAMYGTSAPGDPFLAVALIMFDADEAAIEHYELLESVFVASDALMSEVDSADENLIDRVSALIDRDGIGRTTVLRQNNYVLTVSIGPTTSESLWTTDDVYLIAESIVGRAQG
jgi:hypothetical protein